MPELKGMDPEQVSSASKLIPDAIRKFYYELIGSKERNGPTAIKRSIYSIDDVRAGTRVMGLVSFSVRLNSSSAGMVEPDLSGWRSDQELEDRARIVNSVSQFVEELKVHRTGAEADAFMRLIDVAPEFLKEFIRADGLAVDRYFREASVRVGDARSDRPTIPILGNVTTSTNIERLRQIIRYARRRKTRPSSILWVKPRVKSWGATDATVKVLDLLVKMVDSIDDGEAVNHTTSICLSVGEPDFYLKKMFDVVPTATNFVFPQALEILLVPGLLVVMLVHAPVGSSSGFPIPLGLASFDGQVVERVHELVREGIVFCQVTNGLLETIMGDLDRLIPPVEEAAELAEETQ